MKRILLPCLTAILLSVWLPAAAQAAESPSVLLQKGIYAEETEGDLDAAIKIYEAIVKEAEANRSLVAQAQYRLSVCLSKKGKRHDAVSNLNHLLAAFPGEVELKLKAQAMLRELGHPPAESIVIRKIAAPTSWDISVSRDGRFISYLRDSDLMIFDIGSGESHKILEGLDEVSAGENRVFSPDGRHIAYVQTGGADLYVMGADGSEPKRIYQAESGWSPEPEDWSSDRQYLVLGMWHWSKGVRIGLLTVATGSFREIQSFQRPGHIGPVRLSPDGEQLAYRVLSPRDDNAGVFVVDIPTGTRTRISDRNGDELVGWVPGTSRLVFLSDRTGVNGLWSVEVKKGKPASDPQLRKANVGTISPVGIAQDGTFFYHEVTRSTDIYLATANFDTGEVPNPPTRLTDRSPGRNSRPIWSVDGQRIGFVRMAGDSRSRGAYFCVLTLATGVQTDFSLGRTFIYPIQAIDWSPDGKLLLVQTTDAQMNSGIHKFELESGRAEPIVTRRWDRAAPGDWNSNPRFSPDGKTFYYARRKFTRRDGEFAMHDLVLRRDLATGQEQQLHESLISLNIWGSPTEVSPSGHELATMAGEQGSHWRHKPESIETVPLDGGPARTLVTVAPPNALTRARWTPDGRRIVFIKDSKQSGTEMWSIPAKGGEATKIELQLAGLSNFSICPDGRRLLVQVDSSGSSGLWAMENAFPKVIAAGEQAR